VNPEPEPVLSPIPSEHADKKFTVFRSKMYGTSFFSHTGTTYESNWYDILASFDTVSECQDFLGYKVR
jgi:hypothetical protein